jgi:ferric-dicitrate binding protein FerR (iron transport regulator)
MAPINELIVKYLNNSIGEDELRLLEEWIKESGENRESFKNWIRDDSLITVWSQKEDNKEKLQKVFEKSHSSGKVRKLVPAILKYAAVLIVPLGIAYGVYFYQNKQKPTYEPQQITLKLEDGTLKLLSETNMTDILDANGNKVATQKYAQLDYSQHKKEAADSLIFNELTVPEGRRFKIILSDSTVVYLNSGTRFKFPKSFIKNGNRDVYVWGEGYFSVTKDKERPFVVHTEDIDVQVLGTKFNVRAYGEDEEVKTSLVEGSIGVKSNLFPEKHTTIVPGEAAFYNTELEALSVQKVVIENDVAWIEDRLLFIGEPFAEVVKKIERSYGVKIINQNDNLNNVRFYGDFDINQENVKDVLDAFSAIEFFEYTFKNKTITLKK